MFMFGGWFESSSSGRMFYLQDFYFLEPSSVTWNVPRVRQPPHSPLFALESLARLCVRYHMMFMRVQASGCPPSARAYAAAVGLKDSFVLVGGCEGHLPWQVHARIFVMRTPRGRLLTAFAQFKNDVHVFSLKFDVSPGHTARLTHNKSDLTTGVWSRCAMGGGPPFPFGRAQHCAGDSSSAAKHLTLDS